MAFQIDEEDELDLDSYYADVTLPDPNMYIANGEKAIGLISELIRSAPNNSQKAISQIQRDIDHLFSLFEAAGVESGLELYEQFLDICAKLSAGQKIRRIQDKVVISFGGAFSAGKSKFINSISGIKDILPVAQAPTTSIPTYIIHSDKEELRANSIYGYSTKLSGESMKALTHEFYDVYRIGFSSFVESVIVESTQFSLPKEIALLDTPGYTKYDEKSDTRMVLSDRERAFEQLRATDYLIWLIDIESGAITQEDITFIESLRIKTPILIVFTKADLKTDSEIKSILKTAQGTVKRTAINCYGITAFSSNENREYNGNLIPQFLNYSLKNGVRNNDLLGEYDRIEKDMRSRISRSVDGSRKTARVLFDYITRSYRFLDIRALVALWGTMNQEGYRRSILLKQYENLADSIRRNLENYIRQSE